MEKLIRYQKSLTPSALFLSAIQLEGSEQEWSLDFSAIFESVQK